MTRTVELTWHLVTRQHYCFTTTKIDENPVSFNPCYTTNQQRPFMFNKLSKNPSPFSVPERLLHRLSGRQERRPGGEGGSAARGPGTPGGPQPGRGPRGGARRGGPSPHPGHGPVKAPSEKPARPARKTATPEQRLAV